MNDPKRISIVALGLITLCVFAFGIKGHMDSDGYKNQVNYTTAIQSHEKNDFNYIVDSQQGRVLANGTFTTTKDKPAKFDEMTQGFTYVKREKEHYTMHTYTTCSKNSCTTHVYYSWDEVSSDAAYANKITFMGRSYNPTLFNFSAFLHNVDACTFTAKDTDTGFFSSKKGCSDGNYYLDNDDRYVYATVPLSFSATFLATTYGGLKPFNENTITLQNKSISRTLHDVGRYQLIGFWVLIVIIIILAIAGCFIAYGWVMEDGVWSLYR